jgi:hypothetical protein
MGPPVLSWEVFGMLPNTLEVCERLTRIARLIGRTVGIELGVSDSGDRLVFVDSADDPVALDGDELVAATAEEIAENVFLGEFYARATRAAVALKWREIEASRTP